MVNGIRTSDPCGLNKECGLKFHVGSRGQQTTEEGSYSNFFFKTIQEYLALLPLWLTESE